MFLIAAYCKREGELPATTHTAIEVLAEVNGKTQSTEHQVPMLVPADSKVLKVLHFLVGS